MPGGDVIDPFQIGYSARHFEHAVISASREVEAAERLLQQRDTLRIGCAQRIDLGHGKLRVGLVLARQLALPRDLDACLQITAGFAVRLVEQIVLRHGRDFDLDVSGIHLQPVADNILIEHLRTHERERISDGTGIAVENLEKYQQVLDNPLRPRDIRI